MKKQILPLILFFLVSTCFSQEVIENKTSSSNKVIIKVMLLNGSIADPVGKEGLTSLTASLLVSGSTKQYTYAEIQKLLYPMSASYYANVDKEVTILTFQVPSDFLEEFYPIMRSILFEPAFDKNDFERLKSEQENYVSQIIRASSDEEYSKKALEDLLFRGTRYQHLAEGTLSSLKNITLDNVKDHYYKTFFLKDRTLIGISGNYNDKFLSILKNDALLNLKDLKLELPIIKPTMPDGIRVEIISKKGAFGSAIFMGFPIDVTRRKDDFIALMVANSYLGEHRKSYGVLYNKIRETRSMNYGDYSYIEWYDNGGANMLLPSGTPRNSNYFSIWIRPVQIAAQLKKQYPELENIKLGHAHFAIRLAIRELENLVKNGLTEEQFEETRQFLQSYIKLYIQRQSERLGYLLDSKFYSRKDFIAEAIDILSKLTLEDVNNTIRKYLQTENMYIVIVTDQSEAEALAQSLLNNSYSPMSYSNIVLQSLPKVVLEEDEIIANYKLNVKSVKIVDNYEFFK
ncbi:MAG: M16 family metallopeptidase [Ignavibacteria bacterium]